MAEGIPSAFAVDLTKKWRALAERRKAHLVDLYDSGRWRLYYSEQEFVLRLREAIRIVEKWSATERSAACEAALPNNPAEAVNGAGFGDADEEVPSVAGEANGAGFGDADEEVPSVAGEANCAGFGDADEEVPSVAEAANGAGFGDADEEGSFAEDAIRESEPA